MVLRRGFFNDNGKAGSQEKVSYTIERENAKIRSELATLDFGLVTGHESRIKKHVKAVKLTFKGEGMDEALQEVASGNIVLLNVKAMLGSSVLRRNLVRIVVRVKDRVCSSFGGDVGQVSDGILLLTPRGIIISSEKGEKILQ